MPSPTGPGRFERGTASFEQLAGVAAAVDWLAGFTDTPVLAGVGSLAAMGAIERYLDELAAFARDALAGIDGVRILGSARRRTSTISFAVRGVDARRRGSGVRPLTASTSGTATPTPTS